ncbi:MAG TPA: aldose epimerase family protein [Flavisolibacter sp.]|nr:aldose epimerase family protein [Flavisolibacter sp.]
MKLDKQLFDREIGGKPTALYVLKNGLLEVAITNLGARIVALLVGREQPVDVVAGFDNIEQYLSATEPFHGAIVGRYANRIARGRFSLNGRDYQLSINNEPNHLHGGPSGFHNQVWKVEEANEQALSLSYLSPDGEENYPGNLQVRLRYSLQGNGDLRIDYEAETDKATVFNITSHPFFNLNGQASGTIENHRLQVMAGHYNPVDQALIPTGISPVEGTPFDFREPMEIGRMIDGKNDQLTYGGGYDHNFVLNPGQGIRLAAIAIGDRTGITMEVHTDQPGMQLYSGNFMKGDNRLKYGQLDNRREAFCLETQHFPDSPNQPDFPSTVLEPGQVFRSTTIYRFSL